MNQVVTNAPAPAAGRDAKPRTGARDFLINNFINGEFVAASDGKTFSKRSPVHGEILGTVAEAGRADVDAAVLAARSALAGPWGKLPTNERADLLHGVANEINRRFADFLAAEVADTGKPAHVARHVDIPRGAANFKVFADAVRSVSTECFETTTPDGLKALNYQVRRPVGVVAVICPWNFPLLLMTWKVGPALACGNSVVVKPSEETPQTAALLAEVMNTVGVPRGVYNVVQGFGPGSAGEFLTRHPGVDAITFTGETGTGQAVMQAAAQGARPVSLELGGKNPAIVFADCNFDAAIEGTLRSAFANTGQVCLGTERVYVERAIFSRFVEAMKNGAERLKPGQPEAAETSLGPLISIEHRTKVLSYYKRAVEEGATLVTGGGVPAMPEALQNGAWVQPTIWTGLPQTASAVREEIFGPCCHITPFDSEEMAIDLANDTHYGLCASVWTTNLERAHRVGAALSVGVVWINSWFLRDLRTSFGGAKQSGIGREGGVHSLDFYTESKNICIKL